MANDSTQPRYFAPMRGGYIYILASKRIRPLCTGICGGLYIPIPAHRDGTAKIAPIENTKPNWDDLFEILAV